MRRASATNRPSRPTSSSPAGRLGALVLAVACGLGAVACSSNGQPSASPATTAASGRSGSGATTTVTGSSSTAGSVDPTSSTPGAPSGSDSSLPAPSIPINATPGNEPFCVGLATATQQFAVLAATASSGSTPGLDAALVRVKALYDEITRTAPPEPAADLQTINAGVQRLAGAAAMRSLDADAAIVAAQQRVGEWAQANCGFDPATFQPTG